MTDGEKRQQKAMVLLDYDEAKQNLAHLEEKALRNSEMIRTVAQLLYVASSRHSSIPDALVNDQGESYENAQLVEAMNLSEAVVLVQQIKKARQTLVSLERRKQNLRLE